MNNHQYDTRKRDKSAYTLDVRKQLYMNIASVDTHSYGNVRFHTENAEYIHTQHTHKRLSTILSQENTDATYAYNNAPKYIITHTFSTQE